MKNTSKLVISRPRSKSEVTEDVFFLV